MYGPDSYGVLFVPVKAFDSLHKTPFSEPRSDSDTFNVSGGRGKSLGAREYAPVNSIWQLVTSGRHHLPGRVFEKISAADQVDDFSTADSFLDSQSRLRTLCTHKGPSARDTPKTSRYLGLWGPF